MLEPHFLTSEQGREYTERAGGYSRLVTGLIDGRSTARPTGLADRVTWFVQRRLLDDAARGFHCLAVSARHGDGISWAATQAMAAARAARTPRVVAVRPRAGAGNLPEIVGLIPRRAVLRAARDSGLRSPVRHQRPHLRIAIVLGAVLLGATAVLLTNFANGQRADQSVLVAVLIAVSIAALTVAGQVLGNWLSPKSPGNDLAQLATELEQQLGTDRYREFVELLAREFTREATMRCVVVDDFSRLDDTTRDVLVRYLLEHANRTRELWIVLDGYDYPANCVFQQLVLRQQRLRRSRPDQHASPLSGRQTELCELQPLTSSQRRRLAEEVGFPERAGYLTVKAIMAEREDSIILALQSLIPAGGVGVDRTRFAAFELLYLLSLDAATRGKVDWSDGFLVSSFAQDRVRTAALRRLLHHQPLTRGGLATRLTELRRTFSGWVTTEDSESMLSFRVDPQLGDVLQRDWARYGLADPRLGHLFWAVYWAQRKTAAQQDPLWTDKVASHLDLMGHFDDLADELGADAPALADTVFQTLATTARVSLQLCQVHHVPRLAELSAGMLEDPEFATASRIRQLRRVVNEAYSVLGDDRLLPILLELHPADTTPPPDRPSSLADSLEYLFFASLDRVRDRAPVDSMVAEVRRDRTLQHFAELRGAWLALSIQPFVSAEASPLLQAVSTAHGAVERLGRDAIASVEEVQDRPLAWSAAQFVALSTAVWAWAWSGQTGRMPADLGAARDGGAPADAIAEALQSAYLIADRLRVSRFSADETTQLDFVLDGLAEELLTVTAVAALSVLAGWDDSRTAPAVDILEDVLAVTLADLSIEVDEADQRPLIRTETARLLEERMALLQVTWSRLGFARMAAELNIRAAQFALLWRRDEAAAAGSLTENLPRRGILGLLANVVLAEHAALTAELAAELLVHAVRAALAVRMDERLCGQLCLIGVLRAHSYGSDVRELTGYLLRPTRTYGSAPLRQELSAIADDSLERVTLALANVAAADDDSGESIRILLRERLDSVGDNPELRNLHDVLDVMDYRQRRRRDEPLDPEVILDSWATRRDSDYYPTTLLMLLEDGRELHGQLAAETAYVLANWRSYLRVNGIVLLAYQVADQQQRQGANLASTFGTELVLEALRGAHRDWESNLSAEVNLDMIELLVSIDPSRRTEYRVRQEHWVKVQLELIEQRKLPRLIEEGRWVLLVLDLWNLFRTFGLRAAGTASPRPEGSRQARLAVERARLSAVEKVPPVMVGDPRAMSRQFLRDAQLLFDSQLSDEPSLEDTRRLYNDAAERAVPQIYGLLDTLGEVPSGIKMILRRHRLLVVDQLSDDPPMTT